MATSTRDIAKLRNRRPKGAGVPVIVRLQPMGLAEVDAWIAAQPDPKPSRPEAIRRLVERALKERK